MIAIVLLDLMLLMLRDIINAAYINEIVIQLIGQNVTSLNTYDGNFSKIGNVEKQYVFRRHW